MNIEDIRKILEQLNEQLKIANQLKAWELKIAYREMAAPYQHAEQIDAILNGTTMKSLSEEKDNEQQS